MRSYALLCAAFVLAASAASAGETTDWRDGIGKSLGSTITLSWEAKKVDQALAFISKQTGVTIAIDKAVAGTVANATVTLSVADVPMKAVLGLTLKAAGLRYTLRDGGIFVSTPERLVALLLSGDKEAEVAEAEPMTEGDAIAVTNEADVASDIPDLSNPYDAIGFEPWKKPVRAYRDPNTGVMQFPAPDVWIEAEDKDNPRFKFQSQPSYLKPEELWKLIYSKDPALGAQHELLGRLAKLMADHPEWTQQEVLLQLLKLYQAR